MFDVNRIEKCFVKYSKDLNYWLPEDIFEIDQDLLKKMNLDYHDQLKSTDPKLTQYFHVIETLSKITLVNDEFVVWIVPEINDDVSRTYTLVARNVDGEPHLELAFITSGALNNSRLILRILEKLLYDIHENEEFLNHLA